MSLLAISSVVIIFVIVVIDILKDFLNQPRIGVIQFEDTGAALLQQDSQRNDNLKNAQAIRRSNNNSSTKKKSIGTRLGNSPETPDKPP